MNNHVKTLLRTRSKIVALALVLQLSAFAQDPPTAPPSPEPSAAPTANSDIIAAPWQVGDPCKDYKNTATPQSQRFEYCAAAEQSEKAAKKNAVSWKIWAGVATVCGAYCAANWAGGVTWAAGFQIACTAGTVGATIKDFMDNKELGANAAGLIGVVSSIGGLGNSFSALGIGNAGKGAEIAAEANAAQREAALGGRDMQGPLQEPDAMTQQQGVDKATENAQGEMAKQDTGDKLMACVPFITATFTSVQKSESEKDEKAKAKENLALASKLKAPTQLVAVSARAPGIAGRGGSGSAGGVSGGGPGDVSAVDPITQICDTAAATNDALPSVQCALASDRRLSPNIGGKDFQDKFANIAGMDLGKFLSNAQTPGQAIGAGLANSIGAEKATEMASAISAMNVPDTMYAGLDEDGGGSYSGGGGGRRAGSGGDSSKEFAAMMQGLMGKMTGEDGEAKRDPALVTALEFKMAKMRPEEVEGSREISLFDRVALRYKKTKPRLAERLWVVPYNKANNGQQ